MDDRGRTMPGLKLANRPEEVGRAVAAVRDFALAAGLAPEGASALALAVDEAVSNIISHAGLAGAEEAIHIDAAADEAGVAVVVADRGAAFNPLAQTVAAPQGGPEERPVGGLGIHLMRNLVDRLDYRREGEWNRLTLRQDYRKAACGAPGGT